MSSITIHDWKEVDKEGDGFEFVKPEYHPTWWAVRRWWYRGPQAPYVSCTRVDYDDYQVYVDGTTPLMNLKIDYDGSKLVLSEERDIRRILICKDLGAVNRRETDEYLDIEYLDRYGFVVRQNGLPDPIVDIPVEWTVDPTYLITDNTRKDGIPIGDVLTAVTGDYVGGMDELPPGTKKIVFRCRWQVTDQAGAVSNSPWINTTPLTMITLNPLEKESWWPDDYKDIRFQNQVRDYNPETGATRNSNKFCSYLEIEPERCTPFNLLPDLGSSETTTNLCYEGGYLDVQGLEFLPS